jgi:hypothetical protein
MRRVEPQDDGRSLEGRGTSLALARMMRAGRGFWSWPAALGRKQAPSAHRPVPVMADAPRVRPPRTERLGAPGTLRQLGVPAALAHDMEAVLRTMNSTREDRIVGFSFRTPDDALHALVLEPASAPPQTDPAAGAPRRPTGAGS